MGNKKLGIGIIGCGTISDIYLTNLTKNFDNVEVLACADMFLEKAEKAKETYGVKKACTVDELIQDDNIALVVNLTIPAAHFEINKRALEAGKHVYCEKPFTLSLKDAEEMAKLAKEKGLLIGSAPDTFLGAGLQTCRKLLDDGVIGTAVGFTANLVSPGHELWHPAPLFYYQTGGGPMLDMGPYYLTALTALLGPIKQLSCFAKTSQKKRPVQGKMIDVEVLTHYTGLIEFACGVIGNVNMSFDVWDSDLPLIEIYGTKGVMRVPDPNMFGGPVTVFDGEKMAEVVSRVEGDSINRLMKLHNCSEECLKEVDLLYPAEDIPRSNMRGFGVAEMAQAILDQRPCRLSGEFSAHVIEALTGFEIAAKEQRVYQMKTTCKTPEPLAQGMKLWEVK